MVDALALSLSAEAKAIVAGALREAGQGGELVERLLLLHRRLDERLGGDAALRSG